MYPILFHLGQSAIRSYGVLVAVGYFVGALWLMFQLPYMEASLGEYYALGYSLVLCGLLGGRVGYYIVEWRTFIRMPWRMLHYWRTGWVYWFGILSALLGGFVFQQIYNRIYRPRKYLPVADYALTAISIGHIFGRIGCFLNGCCYGSPTTVPWAVRFTDPLSTIEPRLLGVPLHPTQLYEAMGDVAISSFLVFYVLPRIRKGRFTYGTAGLGYIILYSTLRFADEFFRGDPRGVFLSPVLSPSQWVSMFAFLVAGVLLYRQGILERHPKTRSMYLPARA